LDLSLSVLGRTTTCMRILSLIYLKPYTHLLTPLFFFNEYAHPRDLHSFPTRRSSDLTGEPEWGAHLADDLDRIVALHDASTIARSEEHTSELQSRVDLVCRLLLEKKKYR